MKLKLLCASALLGLAALAGAQIDVADLARTGRTTEPTALYTGALASAPTAGKLDTNTFFTVLNKQSGWWYADALATLTNPTGDSLAKVRGYIPGWQATVGREAVMAFSLSGELVSPQSRIGLRKVYSCGPLVEDFNGDGVLETVVGAVDGSLLCLSPTRGSALWLVKLAKKPQSLVAFGAPRSGAGGGGTTSFGIQGGLPVSDTAAAAQAQAGLSEWIALKQALDNPIYYNVAATDGSQVKAFDGNSGDLLWTYGLAQGGPVRLAGGGLLPALLVASEKAGLLALDQSTGLPLWQRPDLKPAAKAQPVVGDLAGLGELSAAIALAGGGTICVRLADGAGIWRAAPTLQNPVFEPGRSVTDYLMAGYDPALKALVGLRTGDGSLAWTTPVGAEVVGLSAGDIDYDGATELVASLATKASGLLCCDLWSGAIKYRVTPPAPPTSPAILGNLDYDSKVEALVNTQSGLAACYLPSGTLAWQLWVGGDALAPAIGEFDSDGLTDILALGPPDGLFWLKASPSPRVYLWACARGDAFNSGNVMWAMAYGERLIEAR